jgi:hypothetical protein
MESQRNSSAGFAMVDGLHVHLNDMMTSIKDMARESNETANQLRLMLHQIMSKTPVENIVIHKHLPPTSAWENFTGKLIYRHIREREFFSQPLIESKRINILDHRGSTYGGMALQVLVMHSFLLYGEKYQGQVLCIAQQCIKINEQKA